MTELAALLFDVDGTLADTERDGHWVAFNATFAAHGLDWHWSEALYRELLTVTGGKERMLFYLDHYRPEYPKPPNLTEFIATLYHDKNQRYIQLLREGRIPLRLGVKRVLTEARAAGLRLAIVTTTSLDNVIALLKYNLHPEAIHWFELIAAGDIVPAKKPASDIYDYVLEKLNLQANQCIAIEDSENGLRSALGANIPTLVTVNEYTHMQNFSGASLVLDHLGEPYQPFTVLAGTVGKSRWVDVALLRQLGQQ